MLLSPSQSDMVFGACPVLSFTSPPSSRWVEPREPLQGAAYAVQKAAVFPPRKKKIIKAASAPAARKVPIPSAGYLEKQSDSRSEAVAAATEPGNSNAGGGLFLILPSIYPAQELPSLLFLPSFKVSHSAEQNTEEQGREGRTEGGKTRRGKELRQRDYPCWVNGKSASRDAFKPC